ncbi:hypothetical protein LTR78_010267 [Recurvomyces mirabilis]|uniref:BTB domain-containing protein n=1 Tax=Recurvomyces mirabilis TaxID=574656 RepID=A0AAE0TSG3_9PEZI|nr:hypothetical protein LTR78_010267 [Recurvomyces mirabilis]KAK5156388.1 hypothetical protein LTS14_005276 [Recurvomyces mirabilis]
MAQRFDEKSFFDQEAFSDVTIKFGARERRCHRMILCSKSKYFAEMCGPNKTFAEAQQSVIELKDDVNEDAVEAMLRWLYTFDYQTRQKPLKAEPTAEFHLDVCVVADKYLLTCLSAEALSRLRVKLEVLAEAQLTAFIEQVYFSGVVYPANVVAVVDAVRDIRLRALLKHEAFRSLMRGDTDLSMSVVDRLVLDGEGKEMKAMYVGKCSKCPRLQFGEGTGIWVCPARGCPGTVTKLKVWQEREVTDCLANGSPASPQVAGATGV